MKVIQAPFDMSANTVLKKDPVELIAFLHSELNEIEIPEDLTTKEQVNQAVAAMNQLTAYICYFKEMELIARVKKRQAKNNKKKELTDHYLSMEDAFETYKRICEHAYEKVTKLMTMKRLNMDEAKLTGKTV